MFNIALSLEELLEYIPKLELELILLWLLILLSSSLLEFFLLIVVLRPGVSAFLFSYVAIPKLVLREWRLAQWATLVMLVPLHQALVACDMTAWHCNWECQLAHAD